MMSQASMSVEYWDQIVTYSVYLINHLQSSCIHKEVPYQKLFKNFQNTMFGCASYPLLTPYNQHKLQPRSQECLFLGYSLSHQGYKCMAADGRIYISKDVLSDELSFPFLRLFGEPALDSPAAAPASPQQSLTVLSAPSTAATSATPVSHTPASQSGSQVAIHQTPTVPSSVDVGPASDLPDSHESLNQESLSTVATSSVRPENTHPMCTRAKAGIVKPRLQPTLLLAHAEPKSTKSALSNPTWLAAMKAEHEALMNNGTWSLTDLPPNRSLGGCKWVFRVKENPDGTISKYKARLVAKGFH